MGVMLGRPAIPRVSTPTTTQKKLQKSVHAI